MIGTKEIELHNSIKRNDKPVLLLERVIISPKVGKHKKGGIKERGCYKHIPKGYRGKVVENKMRGKAIFDCK